jgi:hypothetical protein
LLYHWKFRVGIAELGLIGPHNLGDDGEVVSELLLKLWVCNYLILPRYTGAGALIREAPSVASVSRSAQDTNVAIVLASPSGTKVQAGYCPSSINLLNKSAFQASAAGISPEEKRERHQVFSFGGSR